MANQIGLIASDDLLNAGEIFFVGVTFYSAPFAHPSRDSILSARLADSETVIDIIDIQSDTGLQDKFVLKCVNRLQNIDETTAAQYVMNILNYMSENIVRVFGTQITEVFYTSDDNFPTTGSTQINPDGSVSSDPVNPTSTDVTSQVTAQVKDVVDQVKTALPNSSTVIIILIIAVIGIAIVAYIIHEA